METAALQPLNAYLRYLYERSGLSYGKIAKAGGYKNPSSVQKYFDNSTHFDGLAIKTAQKLAKALYGKGDPPIDVLDLAPLVGIKSIGPGNVSEASVAQMLQLEVAEKSTILSYVAPTEAGRMPVVGGAHASFWMPSAPSLDQPEDWLTVPFMSSRPLAGQYALRIIGPSVNKVASDGDYAICREFGGTIDAIPGGKFVHAQRERRGEFEWTLKKAVWTAGGLSLHPHSDHPDHQEPLAYKEDDATMVILGIVIAWFRPA